ncbi:P-loop containing nucleoside triphosphate hydrolase protein [Boletus reticuloceps]|uniref:ATP-dependent RNA helicase n=1 Tax=Boletus reticuloceps TaxID=495285 RepID=A0A8I2YK54_9AGAM|nr:P-loop containing nucleoside triphosphate hydrolase protein [Boletus reticuloceps]
MADAPQPRIRVGVSKTKAKARYLKHKKLRRKARKASAPRKPGDAAQAGSGSEEDGEHHDHEEGSADEVDDDGTSGERVIAKERRVQPLKKKRRVVREEPDSDVGAHSGGIRDSEDEELPSMQKPLAIPAGTLPSFPLPTAPSAPPKSVLAMQGIDKALVHAEVISPASVVPLSTAEQDPYDSGLSLKTRRRLFDLGISELFAVQTTLLPFLIRRSWSLYTPYSAPHDVCVSAPTGSGKTLAYVLPILEVLSNRIVTRLRALIVLPTRDLVLQVRETFEAVGKGRGLKIGTATGQHSFAHEQAQLVSQIDSGLQGGSSKVDILICTPGRLMDHLNGTPNFSLQHLRFLVIDEADRLLSQSFQDWLAQVLTAIHWRPSESSSLASRLSSEDTCQPRNCDSLAPACLDFVGYCQVDVDEQRGFSCQKLLFSATLTRDPGKLASLGYGIRSISSSRVNLKVDPVMHHHTSFLNDSPCQPP